MARKRVAKRAAEAPQAVEVIEQNREFSSDVGGRPEFDPTYSQRNAVRLMKADGWAAERIARRIGISANTLRKHFGVELSDGADEVRLKTLEDLQRASAKGKVAASNALLRLSGLEPPPPPPKSDPVPDSPQPEKLGKKELARRAAVTAEEGTSWHELMSDSEPVN